MQILGVPDWISLQEAVDSRPVITRLVDGVLSVNSIFVRPEFLRLPRAFRALGEQLALRTCEPGSLSLWILHDSIGGATLTISDGDG